MKQVDIVTYYFNNDGDIPNNKLPILIYKNALKYIAQKDFEFIFSQNVYQYNNGFIINANFNIDLSKPKD